MARRGATHGVTRVEVVGLGGRFIVTPDPPQVGTFVKLVFEIPEGEIRARALVRSSMPGKGMGVEFIGMDYSARSRLTRLLKRLLEKQ